MSSLVGDICIYKVGLSRLGGDICILGGSVQLGWRYLYMRWDCPAWVEIFVFNVRLSSLGRDICI